MIARMLAQKEKSDQLFRAIAMKNRLSVADIKRRRAKILSDSLASEIEGIRFSISSLTDSLILGEDVRPILSEIDRSIAGLEERLTN